ncbi:meiosis 1 arrest [Brachionus plicatilis]|uniref:Meiosis 1 arrest n=1 Tax=Brachionus plicatilis TaxID=10195 RepID=A0A3M7SPL8_BRAPC|nr:meiosis 1 arrest [Brachionus plicatilis]
MNFVRKREKNNLNTRFAKQTGKIIIFDLDVFNQNEIGLVCLILKEYFEIICSLVDVNNRIPYLIIVAVISNKMDSFLFLDSIYGKNENVFSFLNKMLLLSSPSKQKTTNYALIIEETVRKLSTLIFKSDSKVEIEIFAKNMHRMECLKLNHAEEKIKKILLVNLYKESKVSEFDIDLMDVEDARFVVEIFNMKIEKCILMEHLKNWLNEVAEYEHIQIYFSSNNSVIKCDILERVLDLDKNFDTSTVQSIKFSASSSEKYLQNDIVQTYKLKISKLVSLSGICESILYGQPLILKPTSSSRTSYNETIENLKQFKIFSNYLKENNKGAFCEFSQTTNQILKAKYFLIPVTNKSSNVSVLLMKKIASNSNILNSNIFYNFYDDWKALQSQSEINDIDKIQFFESCLKKIPSCEIYNPLEED